MFVIQNLGFSRFLLGKHDYPYLSPERVHIIYWNLSIQRSVLWIVALNSADNRSMPKSHSVQASAIDIWTRGRLAHLIDNVEQDCTHIFIDPLSEY
jgi:hypothetical protein